MLEKLPPRERQIVDLLYASGQATVAEICSRLPDALSSSAVRAMLTRLVNKGFVTREHTDRGYVFSPVMSETAARRSALHQIVSVFFNGSAASAASALLGMSRQLKAEELDELEQQIQAARRDQRK